MKVPVARAKAHHPKGIYTGEIWCLDVYHWVLTVTVHVTVSVSMCVVWNTSEDREAGGHVHLLAEGV